MSLRREYESQLMTGGLTVEEWERRRGLPRYSVYPEASKAFRARDLGYFMYPRTERDPGRPLEPEFCRQAQCLLALGFAPRVVATMFGVETRTVRKLRNVA